MKSILLATALAIGSAMLPAHATGQPATEAQVEALIVAMDIAAQQEAMLDQMDASMRGFGEALLGDDATPEDVARLERVRREQQAWIRVLLLSDRMMDIYRRALRETFSGDEVEAMTAFYNSPEGRSAMRKMPAMMAVVMTEMQPMMIELLERTRERMTEALAEGASTGTPAP